MGEESGMVNNDRMRRLACKDNSINRIVEDTITFMDCRAIVLSDIMNLPLSKDCKVTDKARVKYKQMTDIATRHPMVSRFRDYVAEYSGNF